jgi:2-keto-3-deoxy-6-phosphogluconate aldolase
MGFNSGLNLRSLSALTSTLLEHTIGCARHHIWCTPGVSTPKSLSASTRLGVHTARSIQDW